MDLQWRTHDLTIPPGGTTQDWLQREWLLTNGTGAFAMGTAAALNTRRYHALLTAAQKPPVGRIVALNQVLEQLVLPGPSGEQVYELTTCAFLSPHGHQVLVPQGHNLLQRFEKGLTVRWSYSAGHAQFHRELFLHWKKQVATLHYQVHSPATNTVAPKLRLWPMLTLRDFHSLLRQGAAGSIAVDVAQTQPSAASITVHRQGLAINLSCTPACFVPQQNWWYGVYYAHEAERGQDALEDYFVPGYFQIELHPGRDTDVDLTVALGPEPHDPPARPLKPRRDRLEGVRQTLANRGVAAEDQLLQRTLALAADDFITERRFHNDRLSTVLAGYPWFADWGRDTFIAFPGLMLVTGRFDEARSTLKVFAGAIREGLVPNCFDDYDQTAAHYNTVDASLWFVHAAIEYLHATGDRDSWKDWLAEAAMSIIEAYIRGTDHDIRMAGDGLITAGSPHTQLTWMDAACDGVVFTPRFGKAVEVNALWYNALTGLADLLTDRHKREAEHYRKLAQRVTRSFAKLFWDETTGSLCDHVWLDENASEHRDRTLRPNQIFAVSLPRSPLPRTKQLAIIQAVRDKLLTPYGLRTLPPDDPRYHGRYTGPRFQRDEAYHQGTIWPWLIGPYAEAVLRAGRFDERSRLAARQALQPLLSHLVGEGLGQLPEICEGDPPHRPVGCVAQAWSVAEVLRVLALLAHQSPPRHAC